jgi:DNA polymerase III subunit alpha
LRVPAQGLSCGHERAPRFIHLRTHTEYSLLEGAVPLKTLVKLCEKHAMPAVAVTDTNNLFAALEFSTLAAGAGIQPILGCQIDLQLPPAQPGDKPRPPAPLVLLAQSEAGYRNLMKLNSCLYLRPGSALPHVTPEELAAHAEGLICLTGGADGVVGRLIRDGQRARAEALVRDLAAAFPGRLYIELQRHPGEGGAPPRPRPRPSAPSSRWPRDGPAAGRHQRRAFPLGRHVRGA